MIDNDEHDNENGDADVKTPRQVKRELLARLDRAADATLAIFPRGAVGTDAHSNAYDAVGSLLGAVKALLVATPAHLEFRRIVLDTLSDAWGISGGDTAFDDAVRQAVEIAETDNRPEKPAKATTGPGTKRTTKVKS